MLSVRSGPLQQWTAFALATLVLAGCPSRDQAATPTRSQQAQIDTLVATNPGWRQALAADYGGNPSDVQEVQEATGRPNPFFTSVVGRGEGSFAVALVRDTLVRVVYFPFREGRYGSPVEVARASWFRAAFVSLQGDTLRIAEHRSDVILDFVWSDSAQKFSLLEESSTALP
jgi:hypothetical protein